MSYLARLNYSFDDRYTVTGTFRTDGSSRFGVNNRWGYFPSVSAGWTISNEPFLKDALENIATVRIRASWGKSGNNDIGNYSSIAGISTGSYAFGTTAVSTCRFGTRMGNDDADQHRSGPGIFQQPVECDCQLLQLHLDRHPL